VRRHRPAVQITLDFDAALEVKAPHLLFGLDTFGCCRHSEADAQTCDRANDREASLVDEQIANKRPINLDLVKREAAQIADAGIARAKVVHRYTDAQPAQLVQNANIAF